MLDPSHMHIKYVLHAWPDRTQFTLSGHSQLLVSWTDTCIIEVQPGIFFCCFDLYLLITYKLAYDRLSLSYAYDEFRI